MACFKCSTVTGIAPICSMLIDGFVGSVLFVCNGNLERQSAFPCLWVGLNSTS